MKRSSERGVALLTVMLLVAAMSALAVGVLDDIRFAIRRTANAEGVGQAQWYALGAESLARAQLQRLAQLNPARTPVSGWNGRPLRFPIDNGVIDARVSDAAGCFNLNSVVEGRGDILGRRERGVQQFTVLAEALGLPSAPALAEALADWVDTNDTDAGLRREDDSYAALPQPYRTGGGLLAEASELRAVRGFTPEVYDRLRPFVCALPTSDLSPINVNTLAPDKAVLVTMLTDGQLGPEASRRLLEARPAAGWPDVSAFWRDPALVAINPPAPVIDQVSLRSRFFGLRADVAYAGSRATLTSLFELDGAGSVKLAARRWSPEE